MKYTIFANIQAQNLLIELVCNKLVFWFLAQGLHTTENTIVE